MKSLKILLATLGVGLCVTQVRAALIAHFKLDEGATEPWVETIYSAVSTNSGTLVPGFSPLWRAEGLAPIPASEGGTLAYLDFPTASYARVLTDVYGPTGATARTVSAWVKFPSTFQATGVGGQGCIVSYGSTSANTYRFTFTLDGSNNPKGRLRFEIAGANMVGNTMVADDLWHHVAMTCPNDAYMSNVVLYVDGNRQSIVASGNLGTRLATSQAGTIQPVFLGATIHNLSTYCGGFIDDVRIYNHQLSDSDVLQLVYGAGTAPSIGQQPAPAEAWLGATNTSVSFSASLSAGSPPITYLWKKDGVNLPGTTGQILTLNPVTAASIGAYSVGITNPFGGVLSTAANLSWATPPVNPREQTVLVGSNATFSVAMPADSAGYTYQWLKAGGVIAGATDSAYTLNAATLGDAVDYSVRVTLAGQVATSAAAPLKVLPAPASPYAQRVLAAGVAAYWRLGELNGAATAADQTTLHPGTYHDFYGTGLQAPGALLDDANTAADFYGSSYVEVPYSPALQRETTYSLEAWVKPNAASGRQSVICSRSQFLSRGYELAASGAVWQFRTGNQDTSISEIWNDLNGGTVTAGEWHHLVATYDGVTKRLYVNGELVGSQVIVAKATTFALRLGAGRTYTSPPGDYLSGTLDDVAVYWRTLTPAQVAEHYSVGRFGNSTPPSIAQDPVAATRYAGGPFSFTVRATGSYPLSYQWTKNGNDLPGATASALAFAALQTSDAGTYAVRVTNPAGNATSASATLNIVPLPTTGYKAVIMADAPAAYFPLDDTNYTTTANELYNFGAYDGSYVGFPNLEQPGATPNTGQSVEFNGASQCVTFGNPAGLNFSGTISLEAWVKPGLLHTTTYGNILAHGYSAAPTTEVVLRMYNGQYQINAYNGTAYGVAFAVPPADIGTWVHLVGTYDGTAWNLYRNGALVARAASTIGALTVSADWAIGARGTGTERFFQGNLDEVALYAAALSPAQVAKHYFAATGQTGALTLNQSGSNVVLTWNAGLLQQADSLTGPWTDLPAAISPLTTPATGAGKFYRLRW